MDNKSDDRELVWDLISERTAFHTPVFDVISQKERAADGTEGDYVAMQAPDWIVTIPVLGEDFIMVRQWRHALKALTTEFPGGVSEPGEAPEKAARRELLEETGYLAGRMTLLGTCSPNPALFKNRVHFYLAEELTDTREQHLDADEFLHSGKVPIQQVRKEFCTGEYLHAFMGTAIALYERHLREQCRE